MLKIWYYFTIQNKKGMKQVTRKIKKRLGLFLAVCMLFPLASVQIVANTTESSFTIVNPYENVNWDTFGQYRAALHMHTLRSDGAASVRDTILDLYNKGFDIVAITDHDVMHDGNWADDPEDSLTESQKVAIMSGAFGRTEYIGFNFPGDFGSDFHRPNDRGGMIPIPFTNEQSRSEHIITLWANFNNESGWTQSQILQETEAQGGIAIIAHPGRYTTGAAGGEGGMASSNNPLRISRYVELFDKYPIALGFELFNRLDNETRSDRILWDNLLQAMMPYGRFVWGFSNDDSHSMNQAGYNFNVLLLPELNENYARESMETGAFYMVTRVNRGIGPTDPEVNPFLEDGLTGIPNGGTAATLFMLHQQAPGFVRIEVEGNTITIEGKNYNQIEWVADGVVIYTGSTFDVGELFSQISTNHVRAQLVGDYGVAYTQPFGILPEGQSFLERPTVNDLALIDPILEISVPHGASATVSGLRLPTTVTAVSIKNRRTSVTVEWDIESIVEYDPTQTEGTQVLTVTGEITLPDDWSNAFDLSLTVTAQVTVGIDPTITIAEANAAMVGTVVTVEGYVTAGRIGDNHRIVIQDSTDPWGGLFIQDVSVSAGAESTFYQYVGQWVSITGTRAVQWHNAAIHATSIEALVGDTRDPIKPIEITLYDFDLGLPGRWNNMLISIEAPLLQRDSGPAYDNIHLIRLPGEGRVDISGILPEEIQDGELIHLDHGIMHWRNDLESHRLHADWVEGTITQR